MKVETKYVADDGKVFLSQKDCKIYEENLKKSEAQRLADDVVIDQLVVHSAIKVKPVYYAMIRDCKTNKWKQYVGYKGKKYWTSEAALNTSILTTIGNITGYSYQYNWEICEKIYDILLNRDDIMICELNEEFLARVADRDNGK